VDRRCLIITYYFPPLGGGGVQRITKLIKYASQQGWRFTVVTADEQTDIIPQDPSLESEIPSSVRVIRVPFGAIPQIPKKKALFSNPAYWKRWLSAMFYLPDSRKKWIVGALPVIKGLLKSQPYDLILISIPPYSLSFLEERLCKEFEIPVILDMRDPWTLNPYKIYPTLLHRVFDRRLEKKIVKRIRYGISAYQSPLEYYREKIENFDINRWTVIPNGYDEDDFASLSAANKETNVFKIGFSGTVYSHINHPTPLFKAFARLKKTNPEEARKLRFVYVGKSSIDLKKLSKKFGLENQVECKGYQPHRHNLEILNSMDSLCFILDDRCPRSKHTVGGKVYEYLRFKKPVLALVPENGEAAQLIRYTESGVVISPQKTEAIAATLLNWIRRSPRFGFRHIEEYSRERQAELFLKVFDEAVGSKKR